MRDSESPLNEHLFRVLLSEDAIIQRVRKLGEQISNDYRGRKITIVCLLKGAVVFLADLLRNIDLPTEIEFVQASSYANGTQSTGHVNMLRGLSTDIKGQHVLVVDDIIDTGLTLQYLRRTLLAQQPASLKLCVLLDKTERRTEDIAVDYVGFEIPDEFVIGYGLDYAGQYRGLPYIAVLEL